MIGGGFKKAKKLDNTALIIVDIQNDFVSGSLATDITGEYVVKTSRWLAKNKHKYPVIVATQDWHVDKSTEHIQQWGEHCMSHTHGAGIDQRILAALNPVSPARFLKGHYDHGYSGFEGLYEDTHGDRGSDSEETLEHFLRERDVNIAHIIGIATEHCVLATALDAVARGFEATVLSDYVNPVDAERGQEVLNQELPNADVSVIGMVK